MGKEVGGFWNIGGIKCRYTIGQGEGIFGIVSAKRIAVVRSVDVECFGFVGVCQPGDHTRDEDRVLRIKLSNRHQNGIVGIVNVVGKNSSRIISLLNTTQHFSVKIKGTNYIGSLSWKEGNPNIAYIEEMAQHMTFHVGDTIVTSGFSTTFPEGIPVGTVLSRVKTSDDNFFTLKIKLASDFPQLGIVRVIKDNFKSELDSLQNFDAINN